MPTLLVTCHPNDRFTTGGYVLHAMLKTLNRSRVTLEIQRLWDERPPVDLVIPHIDPTLVVERFLPERKGGLYGVRQLMVCDNRFVTRHQWSTDPVVKGESVVERRIIYDPPPPEVRAAIDEHGLDFGKVDFTIVDGRAYVFDIARTPTGPIFIKEHPDVIAFLARGLHTLLVRKTDRLPHAAQPT